MDHSKEIARMEAIAASAAVSLITWLIIDKFEVTSSSANVIAGLFFASYISLIILFYIDTHEMLEQEGWPERWYLYLIPVLLPPMNIIISVMYLMRKHHIRFGEGPREWWRFAAGTTVLWSVLLILPAEFVSTHIAGTTMNPDITFIGDLITLGVYTAWVGLPVSIAFDIRKLEEKAPSRAFIPLAMIPIVSVFAGLLYLLQRHRELGGDE